MLDRPRSIVRNVLLHALLYACNRGVAFVPSHGVRLWYYRRVMGFSIGDGSSVFMGAWFDSRRGLTVGRRTTINQNCRIDTRGGVTIGDDVSISADVCVLTADHDMRAADAAGRQRAVRIQDHVFVGTRAMILPGVTVGKGSAVAAGSVVTRDVPPHTIVAGTPARPIGRRPETLTYSADYRRLFF